MKTKLTAGLAATVLLLSIAAPASAIEEKKKNSYQQRMQGDESYTLEENEQMQQGAKAAAMYPNATRVEPKQSGEPSLTKQRNAMVNAYKAEKMDAAVAAADVLYAAPKANANDRSVALQVKTIVMSKQQPDNNAGLVDLLQKAIAENGLDNNTHYAFMLELAQRQLITQDYAGAQASAQRFLTETRSNKPEVLAIEGNAYYRLQKLPEAAEALRGALANNPSADKSWTQMLVKIYYDMGKPDEAAKLAESMVATPAAGTAAGSTDAGALIDLAITYRDSKQMDKAAEVIDRARKAGQLTDARAYQTAFGIYAKLDGHEQDVIDTVNDGLKKGVLTGNLSAYNALAEAYYYSDQIDPAVAAWNQAAPLAKDGQIYLNLAIVLNQEQRFSAAKEAANRALAKGLPAPGDAWKQIAKAEDGLGNAAAAAAARNKAGSH